MSVTVEWAHTIPFSGKIFKRGYKKCNESALKFWRIQKDKLGWTSTVQAPKWSPAPNWSPNWTWNDPSPKMTPTGPEMIPRYYLRMVWRSPGSFRVQFGDEFWGRDHFGARIISGPVQYRTPKWNYWWPIWGILHKTFRNSEYINILK